MGYILGTIGFVATIISSIGLAMYLHTFFGMLSKTYERFWPGELTLAIVLGYGIHWFFTDVVYPPWW